MRAGLVLLLGLAGAPPAPAGSRTSSELPVTLVQPEVAGSAHPVGSRLGPRGWMAAQPGPRNRNVYDLVLPAAASGRATRVVRAPRPGWPHLVTTPTKALIWYEEEGDLGAQMFSVDRAGAKLVLGALPGEWAFDLSGGRTLLVGTNGGKMMIASRWHASVLGPGGARVVASATGSESAWGAVAFGDGFVLAVREPIAMPGATQDQKVAALLGLLDGDGAKAARLAEPARGALVFLDREGRVTKREPMGPQRPAGLAVTEHGWLVVLGEGTLARGLRDAIVAVRAPNERDFRVLVSNLDTPTGLRQRGSWSCLTELPYQDRGEKYVLHCVNPERGLHVATPPIEGIVSVDDIEPGRTWRVWLSRHRYQGVPQDESLTVTLP